MSKELEALAKARKQTHTLITSASWDEINDNLIIVESSLKRIPELEKKIECLEYEKLGSFLYYHSECFRELERLKKAISIIVKKKVPASWLIESLSLRDYNYDVAKERELNQEEYDLLKEVLKWRRLKMAN